MIETNIKFQEEYKRLDALCRDLFSCETGVSKYIEQMEATPIAIRRYAPTWDADYKGLKHSRWLRNQLAHEVSIYSEFCTESDVTWLEAFYRRIINAYDPLAVAYRAWNEEARRTKQPRVQAAQTAKSEKKTLWNRFLSKIKQWFSD